MGGNVKKYKLTCFNCHYVKEVSYEDLFDRECPLCQGEMAYDMSKEKTNKNDFADKIIITQFENEIKVLGNQRCYEIIERLAEPRMRIRHRKYFILAGGFIPESEI